MIAVSIAQLDPMRFDKEIQAMRAARANVAQNEPIPATLWDKVVSDTGELIRVLCVTAEGPQVAAAAARRAAARAAACVGKGCAYYAGSADRTAAKAEQAAARAKGRDAAWFANSARASAANAARSNSTEAYITEMSAQRADVLDLAHRATLVQR